MSPVGPSSGATESDSEEEPEQLQAGFTPHGDALRSGCLVCATRHPSKIPALYLTVRRTRARTQLIYLYGTDLGGPPPKYKVIVLGDGAVGKTSIAMRFTDDYFARRWVWALLFLAPES